MSDGPRKRRSLLAHLVGSFLTVSILTVLFVALAAFIEARSALREALSRSLMGAAIQMEAELNRSVELQREVIALLSEVPVIENGAASLAAARGRARAPSLEVVRARDRVELLLRSAAKSPGEFEEISILSPVAGEVLASTDALRRGDYHVNELFYTRGKEGTFVENVYTSPVTGRPVLTIATPIRDEGGTTVGVLAGHMSLALFDRLSADRVGLGATGEAYLISSFNDFVSSERFGRDRFRRGVFSAGIDAALRGKSGVGLYDNYAGRPVIGAYRWNAERELALVVEMPQVEAFEPARRLVKTILGIGIGSSVLLALVVFFLARRIANPILAVARAATAVAGGDFEARAPVLTSDEVGILARSFNEMAERLRTLYRGLNQQVEATTKALVALDGSRGLLQSILDNSSTPIAVIDGEERFLLLNRSFESLVRVPPERAAIERAGELLPAPFASVVLPTVRTVLKEQRVVERELELDVDGEPRTYFIVFFPLRGELVHSPGVGMVATDLTERKKASEAQKLLEAQVLHAQKLESLGLMAGGIAHDFNNILTTIGGNTELALRELSEGARARGHLMNALTATRQAAVLTGQMLACAGKPSFDQEPVDLNALIREMEPLFLASMSKKIVLEITLSPEPAVVRANRAQLTQLLLNLATNAAEAIGGEPGTVRIATAVAAGEREPRMRGEDGNVDRVELAVADSGSGMDEGTRARIFDPFFSTKGPGRGLGLAAARGIVRSASGDLSLTSSPSEGTRFVVRFPKATFEDEPAAIETGLVGVVDRDATILLVEDESLVRAVARQFLEMGGYRVLEATNGIEAVELYRVHRDEIAAVVMDLTMPGMNGRDALQEIRALDPAVKAILTSGYVRSDSGDGSAREELGDVLQKPYRASTLLGRVARVLRGGARASLLHRD
jgi:PAS domain S-box-containing protein